MNGQECLVELHTPLIGLDKADVAGGVVANIVDGAQCSHVGVLVHVSEGLGVTASDQVTVTLFAVNEGDTLETPIELDGVYVATGDPLVKDGSGRFVFESLEDVESYATPAADGENELLLYFRVRSRQLMGTQTFVRCNLESVNARDCGVVFIREWENAGPSATRTPYAA